jgi:hypothetical protein
MTPTTYNYNFHHSSHTLQDVLNIDVAKLRLVDKRFWNGESSWYDDPWCYLSTPAAANCYLYGTVSSYTGVRWNHPVSLDFPYINDYCHHDSWCYNPVFEGHGHFHTDFTWCNSSAGGQEIDMQNNNYSYADGSYMTDFWTTASCFGLHHATRVWANLNSSVDDGG